MIYPKTTTTKENRERERMEFKLIDTDGNSINKYDANKLKIDSLLFFSFFLSFNLK